MNTTETQSVGYLQARTGFFTRGETFADRITPPADTAYIRIFDADSGTWVAPPEENGTIDGRWMRASALETLPLSEGRYFVKSWGPDSLQSEWVGFRVAEGTARTAFGPPDEPLSLDQTDVTAADLLDLGDLPGSGYLRVHTGSEDSGWFSTRERADTPLPIPDTAGTHPLWVDHWADGVRLGWQRFDLDWVEADTGFDTRLPVEWTPSEIHPGVVAVEATRGSGQVAGSGVLVSEDVVISAAHLVADTGGSGDLADRIFIFPDPAFADSSTVDFSVAATDVQWFPITTENGTIDLPNTAHDTALLALGAPLGDSLGGMAIDPDFRAGEVFITGYSQASGREQTTLEGRAEVVYPWGPDGRAVLQFDTDGIISGMSGGAVWHAQDDEASLVGTVVSQDYGYSVANVAEDWLNTDSLLSAAALDLGAAA